VKSGGDTPLAGLAVDGRKPGAHGAANENFVAFCDEVLSSEIVERSPLQQHHDFRG